jgi:hypothetical protein
MFSFDDLLPEHKELSHVRVPCKDRPMAVISMSVILGRDKLGDPLPITITITINTSMLVFDNKTLL